MGYNNQDGVGSAIAKSGIAREDIFLVSKIPGGFNEADATAALDQSLAQLFPGNADAYVDLMLVHFPATWGGEGGKASRQAEWKALETFAKAGKAKAIGISHYCKKHLDDVLEIATIPPAVNQVQYHGERAAIVTGVRGWYSCACSCPCCPAAPRICPRISCVAISCVWQSAWRRLRRALRTRPTTRGT